LPPQLQAAVVQAQAVRAAGWFRAAGLTDQSVKSIKIFSVLIPFLVILKYYRLLQDSVGRFVAKHRQKMRSLCHRSKKGNAEFSDSKFIESKCVRLYLLSKMSNLLQIPGCHKNVNVEGVGSPPIW
jgi:hypothetical protein